MQSPFVTSFPLTFAQAATAAVVTVAVAVATAAAKAMVAADSRDTVCFVPFLSSTSADRQTKAMAEELGAAAATGARPQAEEATAASRVTVKVCAFSNGFKMALSNRLSGGYQQQSNGGGGYQQGGGGWQ